MESSAPDGWLPIETAHHDGSEIEIWVGHRNYAYATDAEERAEWEGPHKARWTDFNGGGFVW